MSDAPEPAWHLLPQEPLAFFGLNDGYDRKELKRAYNVILRRYKPDKYPQEFQLLRAAYEQLDGDARYGKSSPPNASPTSSFQWRGEAIQPSQSSDDLHDPLSHTAAGDLRPASNAPLPQSLSVVERLEIDSPETIYSELKAAPNVPYDFYALAVLSDSVCPASEQMFLKWILTGLQKHPGHPALMQLLQAYLHSGPIAEEDLSKILIAVSKVVTTDRFYFLSEKLFDRLIVCVPWPKFERVLQACRANIRDHQVRCYVVFLCHLVRRAVWLAPIAACETMFETLDQHHQELSHNFEYDLELNSRLLAYCKQREQFVLKGAVAAMIDSALRSYCLSNSEEADHAIVATQAYIAQHPDQLFSVLGLAPDEDMQLLAPWIWISDDVENRLETQQPPASSEHVLSATYQMLVHIDSLFPPGPIQFYNLVNRGIGVAVVVLLVVVVPIVSQFLAGFISTEFDELIMAIAFAIGCGLSAVYFFVTQPRTVKIWMAARLENLLHKHYKKWWRSLIGRFFAATHLSYRDVDKAIDFLVAHKRNELNVSTWLPHFYSRDVGLFLYATAVRFLR